LQELCLGIGSFHTSFLLIPNEQEVSRENSSLGWPIRTCIRAVVASATFNNNSVISWWSVLLMEEIKVNREKNADLSIFKICVFLDVYVTFYGCFILTFDIMWVL
jgi:hypothetical protein